ncbi:hypothetical protein CLU79DRAFT_727369 [Phycomyces nitens]|nr:hypothetical protein CLU79DRAFT_727369 [Phycomyces nitens]
MGVQNLWTLTAPAARPCQLESLRNRKLAVDASIWMYQFVRSMRDKQGNPMHNAHLLGFFRRICKLLFFNIKPIFVFDGGVPDLKKNVIKERRLRREGALTSMKQTAGKILSAQMKSRILLEEAKRRNEKSGRSDQAPEVNSTVLKGLQQRHLADPYDLPQSTKTSGFDHRLATQEEIASFVKEFKPSEIDFDSDVFQSLPHEIQYEIIQDIMIRSRQTSWDRLDQMLKNSNDPLDFSKQQIKQLAHRNEMTQRLLSMNSAGVIDKSGPAPLRIASERGRAYILYKNENSDEGLGWKLPGLSTTETESVDMKSDKDEDEEGEEDEEMIEVVPSSTPDKVKDAIMSNPALSAMMAGFLSEDEDEDEEEEKNQEVFSEEIYTNPGSMDVDDNDDEPLLAIPSNLTSQSQSQASLLENMEAYAQDDETIQQVLERIYGNDTLTFEKESKPEVDEKSLNSKELYDLWLTRAPDAFVYIHSFNDEHKRLIHDAIFIDPVATIKSRRDLVQKSLGKTKESDEISIEANTFYIRMLESIMAWKADKEQLESLPKYPEPLDQDSFKIEEGVMILDDDEDEENEMKFEEVIHLPVKSSTGTQLNTLHKGSIDLSSSMLRKKTTTEESTEKHPQLKEELKSPKEEDPKSQDCLLSDSTSLPEALIAKEIELNPISSLDLPQPTKNIETISKQELADISEEKVKALFDLNESDEYDSDQENIADMNDEQYEYARFISDLKTKDIESVRQELDEDMENLNVQLNKQKSISDEITQNMIQDIQELLRLFGVPFIISPMEAEAQCAALLESSMIEGIITDDSDVFLFGGSSVYKNLFSHQKYAELYKMQDIAREMQLDRRKLIQIAFFLGSDYTTGIPGIGPVTAMELLDEFSVSNSTDGLIDENEPLEAPLERFRDWYRQGNDTTTFQRRFRKKHGELEIPDNFPDPSVKEAYYNPKVDRSPNIPQWKMPELDSLRLFLMEAFGWSEDKTDEVLLPVIRQMNQRETLGVQSTMSRFLIPLEQEPNQAPHQNHVHKSKRIQNVVDRWRKEKVLKRSGGDKDESRATKKKKL